MLTASTCQHSSRLLVVDLVLTMADPRPFVAHSKTAPPRSVWLATRTVRLRPLPCPRPISTCHGGANPGNDGGGRGARRGARFLQRSVRSAGVVRSGRGWGMVGGRRRRAGKKVDNKADGQGAEESRSEEKEVVMKNVGRDRGRGGAYRARNGTQEGVCRSSTPDGRRGGRSQQERGRPRRAGRRRAGR